MRCLILSPFVPYPPEDGGRIRTHALATGLARRHEVHVLALGEPSDADRDAAATLNASGIPTELVEHRPRLAVAALRSVLRGNSTYAERFDSPRFRDRLRARLASGDYDVVQCEFPYLARHYRPGGPPWVLDQHNVEARLSETLAALDPGPGGALYRLYARREARRRRLEELAACRAVRHVLAVSEADRRRLLGLDPSLDVTVAPNGVDLEYFAPAPTRRPTRPEAVFVGKMDYRPNVDGVLWLCREVLPRIRRVEPEFRLTIVGANPVGEVVALDGSDGVRVTGRVPDTRPYLRGAAVAVVPLRAGSGTRLKILEAFALGCAVVSTAIGCEGIDVEPGRHLLVADDAADFARAVTGLLRNAEDRERLGREARRLVEARYGWPTTISIVERVLEAAIAPSGRREDEACA